MDYKSMGVFISEKRKENHMTQRELADRLSVTDKAVSKWERDISCPDIHTIPRLADVLGVSAEELLRLESVAPTSAVEKPLTERISAIVTLVLKAVGLAMGIAVVVLSAVGGLETSSAVSMLGIGLACLGVVSLRPKEEA